MFSIAAINTMCYITNLTLGKTQHLSLISVKD